MFISNETLVDQYFDAHMRDKDFLRYFMIIKHIIVRYGKGALEMDVYLQSLKKHSPAAYEITIILKRINKLNIKDIKHIINILKRKYAEAQKEFEIITDKSIQYQVSSFITKTFENTDIDYHESSKI